MISTGKLAASVATVAVAASLIEAVVLSRNKTVLADGRRFNWNETLISLADLIGRKLMALLPLSLTLPLFNFVWAHRIHTVHLHGALLVLFLFVGQEFCYYWYHRASHRIRFFWATHAVHHSPNQLTLASAYRLGWTEKLAGPAIFFTPLVFIGVQPQFVTLAIMLNLGYQFWLHNTWVPKLGWFEYVFNTPSAHRVHHASNTEYLDANFGGTLIIFDRLFGTYVEERADLPCVYGLTTPTHSKNPLVVEFEHWRSLARDVVKSKSLGAAVQYVLRPPGWTPEGNGQTVEELRAANSEAKAKAKLELKLAKAVTQVRA